MVVMVVRFLYGSYGSVKNGSDGNNGLYGSDGSVENGSDEPLQKFNGVGGSFDYSNNNISGTVDSSWCNAKSVSFKNNSLSGELPECFRCYLAYDSTIYNAFSNNQFTNYNNNPNIPCLGFKPTAFIRYDDTEYRPIIIKGQNIGFNGHGWYYNGTYDMIDWMGRELDASGSYIFVTPLLWGQNSGILKYFSIRFGIPNNVTYTFSVYENYPPTVHSLLLSPDKKQIIFSGLHFSSYFGQYDLLVNISGINCKVISSYYFNATCELDSLINNSMISKIQSLILHKGIYSFSTFYVNASLTPDNNNKLCPSDCSGGLKGICNMVTGLCKCISNYYGVDCSLEYHYVSAVVPVSIDGGNVTLFGYFSNVNDNLAIKIGGKDCIISHYGTTFINCDIPPGNGVKDVEVFQNGFNWIGKRIYLYSGSDLTCPNDCSSNGKCNSITGECECNIGFSSFDCSNNIKNDTNGQQNQQPFPITNTMINPLTGFTSFINEEVNFNIYLKSLVEKNFVTNETIKEYDLQSNWENSKIGDIYIMTKQLDQYCTIIATIEEIKNEQGKQFEFGGLSFALEKGTIKFTVSVLNYKYYNSISTLRLDLFSSVGIENQDQYNECINKDTEIDTSSLNDISDFNNVQISRNNKILNGRFINRIISDGKSTYLSSSFSKEQESIILSLNLPHCVTSCVIDPDFSVLVANDYQFECGESSRPSWILPVAIIIPFTFVSIVIATVIYIYKTNTSFRIKVFKLKTMNRNHKK